MDGVIIKDEKDSIMLQNLAIVKLLETLHKNDFINSEYFEKLEFDDIAYKNIFYEIGLNNTSTLLLTLFLLLNQLLEFKSKGENIQLDDVDNLVRSRIVSIDFDGECLPKKFDFIKYIRNSIAHYNTSFKTYNEMTLVTFGSEIFIKVDGKNNKQKRNIKIGMYTNDVGMILDYLYFKIIKHLNDKYHSKK